MSRALNESGAPIPKGFPGLTTVSGADGKRYALRVKEFRAYLRATYGPPALSARGGGVPDGFVGGPGIIVFDVRGWSDASGHVDLWNGSSCAYEGYWAQAFEVLLWPTPSATAGTRPAGLRASDSKRKEKLYFLTHKQIQIGSFCFDAKRSILYNNSYKYQLTEKENLLVAYLIANKNQL